jgi:phosphoribosyl 1,2-cyclic phosphate phosphodiesterase
LHVEYPKITVTFLGTGTSSGVPMIGCSCHVCTSSDPRDKRLRSSILVQSEKTTIVVDTTPDFRYQMLREKVMHVDALLFTHPHKDHVAGMDDIRAYNYFAGKPMEIYANEMTERALRQEFPYVFASASYPGIPKVDIKIIDISKFMIGDIPVEPVLVWHLKMPVYGFRFGKFTYITDANRIDDVEKQKVIGCDTLVLNALRKEKHISHFTLDEAIQLSQQLKPRETYLTHLSHQMGRHEEISRELPDGVYLAEDGLKLFF